MEEGLEEHIEQEIRILKRGVSEILLEKDLRLSLSSAFFSVSSFAARFLFPPLASFSLSSASVPKRFSCFSCSNSFNSFSAFLCHSIWYPLQLWYLLKLLWYLLDCFYP